MLEWEKFATQRGDKEFIYKEYLQINRGMEQQTTSYINAKNVNRMGTSENVIWKQFKCM